MAYPNTAQTIELEEAWLLPLQGQIVDRSYTYPGLIFDLIGERRSYHVRMYGDAVFQAADEEVHSIPAEKWAEEKPELVTCFRGRVVNECLAHKDGRLEISFEDGSRLEILPDQEYESWEISGTGDLHVVGLPGGELAIWKARDLEDEQGNHKGAENDSVASKLARPVEFEDFWFLPLRKRAVARCMVDTSTFGLQFGGTQPDEGADFTLYIDGPFRLCKADGSETYLVPPDGVAPALRLPGQIISKAFGYKDGRLELIFSDGAVLTVDIDEGQQWTLTGKDTGETVRVTAVPGAEPRVQVEGL